MITKDELFLILRVHEWHCNEYDPYPHQKDVKKVYEIINRELNKQIENETDYNKIK